METKTGCKWQTNITWSGVHLLNQDCLTRVLDAYHQLFVETKPYSECSLHESWCLSVFSIRSLVRGFVEVILQSIYLWKYAFVMFVPCNSRFVISVWVKRYISEQFCSILTLTNKKYALLRTQLSTVGLLVLIITFMLDYLYIAFVAHTWKWPWEWNPSMARPAILVDCPIFPDPYVWIYCSSNNRLEKPTAITETETEKLNFMKICI